MESTPEQRLVAQALAGHEPALASLVELLTPVVQARVARAMFNHRPAVGQSIRQQVEDLTQEVFLTLFDDDARVIRSWSSSRGLSLQNFVGLVAQRRTISILRTGKRSPWREDPTLDDQLDAAASDPGPEDQTASREEMRLLLHRLKEELSPLGWQLFDLLFIQERSVDTARSVTGMSRDAIYAWRSRLRKLARRLLTDILSESD